MCYYLTTHKKYFYFNFLQSFPRPQRLRFPLSPRGGPRPLRPPGLGLRPRGLPPSHLIRPPSIRLNLSTTNTTTTTTSQNQPVSESAKVNHVVSSEPSQPLSSTQPLVTVTASQTSKPQTSSTSQNNKPLLAPIVSCDTQEPKDASVNVSDSENKKMLLVIH